MSKIEEVFSLDFDLYTIVMSEKRLATWYELQTIYNTEDAYDFLEMLEVEAELKLIAEAAAKTSPK